MPRHRTTALLLSLLLLTLAGCRIDITDEQATPEGYHRMPNGMLMASVQMETVYGPDRNGDGFSLPTYTHPDGTVWVGTAPEPGGSDYPGSRIVFPDPDDFPKGIVPIRLFIPRINVDAPVVATQMNDGGIQGPPVAGDIAWLEQTRRPGEIGPAVLGGVDAIGEEPGAYADLLELQPGDEIAVMGEEGDIFRFRVRDTWTVPVAERADIFAAGDPDREIRLVDWAIDGEDVDRVVSAVAVGEED